MQHKDIKLTKINHKSLTIKSQLKKVKTLDDLFAQDDINEILSEINECKADVTRIVVVYQTSDDYVHVRSNGLGGIEKLGLIEFGKALVTDTDSDEE